MLGGECLQGFGGFVGLCNQDYIYKGRGLHPAGAFCGGGVGLYVTTLYIKQPIYIHTVIYEIYRRGRSDTYKPIYTVGVYVYMICRGYIPINLIG